VIAPDGTLYLIAGDEDAQLVALDRGGHVKPGWPIEEEPGIDFGSPAVGQDGSVYVEACAGAKVGCVVHRFDESGRERTGWPVAIPIGFACSAAGRCLPNGLDIGPDGTVFVSHWRGGGGLQFLAVDASGRIKPGWPVVPAGAGMYWESPQIAADGTLFVLGRPDGGKAPASIAAFGPDGKPRNGWPVSVPDAFDYVLGPKGMVVARSLVDDTRELCLEPRRTVFTALGPDGRTLAGWPRGSTGFASSPVVDAEGTVYYVSATSKVYAHDRAGEVKAGWPMAAHGAGNGCGGGETPHLAPGGTIVVVGDEVTALSPDGHSLLGWPYRPSGDLVEPCLDSDC
jgi:outer membrane protein assembly factor BamB